MRESDPDLLRGDSHLIRRLILELSDACNLRCVYCHQNLPGFTASRLMPSDLFDVLVTFATQCPNVTVDLAGGGDLTMDPEWVERSECLLAAGASMATTVNLARVLTLREIETLARFTWVNVSLDTLDIEILRGLRKSADARTIVYNVMQIRAAHLRLRATTPAHLSIQVVYSAAAVAGLEQLVAFAVAAGADGFGIRELVGYPTIEENAASVWTLTGAELESAVAATRAALELARVHELRLDLPPGFHHRLDTLGREARAVSNADVTAPAGDRVTYADTVAPGFTRDCTDPWTFLQVLADGSVRPCCFSGWSIGRLDGSTRLEDLLNGDVARRIRGELLTGDLDRYCAICAIYGQIPIGEYREKVRGRFTRASQHA